MPQEPNPFQSFPNSPCEDQISEYCYDAQGRLFYQKIVTEELYFFEENPTLSSDGNNTQSRPEQEVDLPDTISVTDDSEGNQIQPNPEESKKPEEPKEPEESKKPDEPEEPDADSPFIAGG